MNVGKNTTLRDRNVPEKSEEKSAKIKCIRVILVQFFVVPDGKLEMTWDDTS